ncbi:PAS domain-containing protein [Kiloniella laminariae]|uniref:PAS domain-containing protein n=1 Tax=Kiloniella laminariae TaxID=454162 RepID=A0ABT4LMN7_9PROT|nr:PAS domain-containing protein [Kiloniella laminariae]MCZ4282398.1 PAS domain-containing protein [Kiloniella laminariae]
MLDVTFRTRTVKLAYQYWLSKCPVGLIPGRPHIDPLEMVAFLPHIILLDVQHNPPDFRYRLIGTKVVPLLNRDYTSEWMSDIPNQKSPSTVWANCRAAVETIEPIYAYTPYVGPKKDVLDVEDLIMPLAVDGKTVDMLFIILAYTKKSKLL